MIIFLENSRCLTAWMTTGATPTDAARRWEVIFALAQYFFRHLEWREAKNVRVPTQTWQLQRWRGAYTCTQFVLTQPSHTMYQCHRQQIHTTWRRGEGVLYKGGPRE